MLSTGNTTMLVVDIQTRLLPSIHNHESLTQKTAACISACQLLNVPIIVLQQYTKGLGPTVPALHTALGDYEPVEKITFSACQTVEFVDKLKSHNNKNVIVTGIEAHICVQTTVLELLAAGYNVYVAADCIGSRNENDQTYAEQRMRQAGAVITTLESILFELLVSADHPMRKEITKLITSLE
ncbi:MAG: hydrolase [Defluviitaleaceae bacterium]|nr:hydrolase [Defluviitaleaceae bacterium]